MKILITTDTPFPLKSEFSNFTFELANLLNRNGHVVSVICPSPINQNSFQKHNGISIYRIGAFNFTQRVFPKHAINKAIAEISPDIIHIQSHFYLAKYSLDYANKFIIPAISNDLFIKNGVENYERTYKQTICT